MLVGGIMNSLTGIFDAVNQQVGNVATQVGTTPASFSPGVFSMIRGVSESVIVPIAGLILTFIACYELIQLIIDHNNLANFETWIFFKWIFKTFVAVMLITNCFNITMAVFDVAQHVIASAGGIIGGNTAIDDSAIAGMQSTLEAMEVGPLLGVYLQTFLLNFGMRIMSLIIFIIIYGRMIEIYLMTSLAPIPFSTFGNREQSQIGQNYLRSLFALGFQGFLIMICVGIYAVLIQGISFSSDVVASIWGVLGYTVLLCFTLFKTGSLAKSVFTLRRWQLVSIYLSTKGSDQGQIQNLFQSDEAAADLFLYRSSDRDPGLLPFAEDRKHELCGHVHDHHYAAVFLPGYV